MKLFRAGFGEHWHYLGADSETEAIKKVKNLDTCFEYLPVIAKEVIEEFGLEINVYSKDTIIASGNEYPFVKGCVVCGKEFYSQEAFLKHKTECEQIKEEVTEEIPVMEGLEVKDNVIKKSSKKR